MTIKHLYPTQHPSLDLNFARTKRLDPRVTFTRGSTATYVGNDGLIKTAVDNEPRFDHDPVTGESLGLLVEEASTNYISNSLTGPAYNRYGISPAIPNSAETTSPDGTNNARLYVATGSIPPGVSDPIIQPAITGGFLSSYSSLTVSVYVKARPGFTATSLRFSSDPGLDNAPFVGITFDPLNYASPPAVIGGGNTSAKAEYIGNGWFRCSASYNGPTITHVGSLQCDMQIIGNGSSSTNGFFLWGEQVELNSYPTSYIPTSGSTITRAADAASITGTNFSSWYNQSEGAIFSESRTSDSHHTIWSMGPSWQNRIQKEVVTVKGQNSFSGVSSSGNFDKIALPIATGTCPLYKNGSLYTNYNGGSTETANIFYVGRSDGRYTSGHISRLAYYPQRLPDATLQALTL